MAAPQHWASPALIDTQGLNPLLKANRTVRSPKFDLFRTHPLNAALMPYLGTPATK